MYQYLEAMKKRLNADEMRQFSDIYAPEVVAVPDKDAWNSLCYLPDGRIRYYGYYRKKSVSDTESPLCYLESGDCGLSWKRHIVESPEVLGASTYVPFLKQYIKIDFSESEGTFAFLGDSPDDTAPKKYKISDYPYFDLRLPFVMRSKNRIIALGHEHRPDQHPTCFYNVVMYSDDGKHWNVVPLSEAPYHEKKWPHKGYRWQQNHREGTIEELSDGSLLLYARTAADYHYISRSSDGGETWTEPTPSCFHSIGTMPLLKRLSDGRLVFFWVNTQSLPEVAEADGIWEDYFTNRDVNHCAISEDDGKTWRGYRELFLNPIRNAVDFRSFGGKGDVNDKSVHQFEALELPDNKMLVAFGQSKSCRRLLIFDINWLYETTRYEDFSFGLSNLSVQSYVKSYPAVISPYVGHCAYNRIAGALLVKGPLEDGHEVLRIAHNLDENLISPICGAVWNFPVAKKGKISIFAKLSGQGIRVSLLDYWMNPCDDTVEYDADFSIILREDMHPDGEIFSEFVLEFDCETGIVKVCCGDYLYLEKKLSGAYPNGLCYLHLQSVSAEGCAYIREISKMDFSK